MNIKENIPLLIAGIAVLAAIYLLSQGSGQSSSVGYAVIPGTGNTNASTTDAQTQALQAQADASYNQNIFGAFGTLAQLGSAEYAANAQSALSTSQAQAQEFLSAEQGQVQITQYNDQLAGIQAQAKAAQNASFWNGLFTLGGTLGSSALKLPLFSGGRGQTYTSTSNVLPEVGNSVGSNVAVATYA